jgi:hypothetical protein
MKVGFDEEWWNIGVYMENPGILKTLEEKVAHNKAIYLHFHPKDEPCVDACRDAAFDPQEHIDLQEFENDLTPKPKVREPEITPGHGPGCYCSKCTSGDDRKDWSK